MRGKEQFAGSGIYRVHEFWVLSYNGERRSEISIILSPAQAIYCVTDVRYCLSGELSFRPFRRRSF